MLNPNNILNEFSKLVRDKYKNKLCDITELEKSLANDLSKYFESIISGKYESEEYLDVSDYESDSDCDIENNETKSKLDFDFDYEFNLAENIDNNKTSKYNLETMKEIVKYSKLKNGKLRNFDSVRNRYRKLDSRNELYRIKEYVKNGGTFK